MKVVSFSMAVCAAIVPRVATFPLHPNQVPDLSFSAALTATSSPPARALAFFSGTETLLETMINWPNGDLSSDQGTL